ncbi:hypothetical protein MBT84_00295 [Streptomyces sp. MBT84]|nr:hypothetical protein [Streptomyces sp. MBT84]
MRSPCRVWSTVDKFSPQHALAAVLITAITPTVSFALLALPPGPVARSAHKHGCVHAYPRHAHRRPRHEFHEVPRGLTRRPTPPPALAARPWRCAARSCGMRRRRLSSARPPPRRDHAGTGSASSCAAPPPPVCRLGKNETVMATIRSLSWRSPLLFGYLAVMTAVQLAESRGGLVRWSDYSVLTPLAAAALVPLKRTIVIGVATLAASVAVYGFAVPGVSDGGRAVVVAAAAVSLGLSPVICRTRLHRRPVACPAPSSARSRLRLTTCPPC